MRFASLAVSALLTFTSALANPIASPEGLTNSERIQRGLPIKAPARRYDPSRTHVLRARASIPVTPPQVIRVTRMTPGERKRDVGDPEFLIYDNGILKLGALGSALTVDLPPAGQLDTQMTALQGSSRLFVGSVMRDLGTNPNAYVAYNFILTTSSDMGQPLAASSQTSIWTRSAANTLQAVQFGPFTRQPLSFYVDTDGSLIGTTFGNPGSLTQLSLAFVDRDAAASAVQTARNLWVMKGVSAIAGTVYAKYNEPTNRMGYTSNIAEATVMRLSASSYNASRTQIDQYSMTSYPPYPPIGPNWNPINMMSDQSDSLGPKIILLVSAGGRAPSSDKPGYYISIGFTLNSYISGISGLVGRYYYSSGDQVDVVFDISPSTNEWVAREATDAAISRAMTVTMEPAP